MRLKYSEESAVIGNLNFKRFKTYKDLAIFDEMYEICRCHVSFLSMKTPKNLVYSTSLILTSSILIQNSVLSVGQIHSIFN